MPRLFHIDAFTERVFKGNPAGVCLLDGPAPEEWMQNVAAELNLSETAFVYADGDAFRLRWFTPTVEVPLCGHATLATAHALWSENLFPENKLLQFETMSGRLTAKRAGHQIELEFPVLPTRPHHLLPDEKKALHIDHFLSSSICSLAVIVELKDEEAVRRMTETKTDLIVTAKGSGSTDFVSRFFAPSLGIPEDPVTGAAHCALADYWSKKLGKNRFQARQVSRRGGDLDVELRGQTVLLRGSAVTFFASAIPAP